MPAIFSFDAMLLFGSLGILLLVGLFLRAKIKFFQKFFVPACIVAGILGLILREVGILPLSISLLETAVYHIFNITFISLGLTARSSAKKIPSNKKKGFRGVVSMGLLIASCASLQFIIGGLLVILFNLFGYKLFPTFGFLVAMGFEEGPGQALSIGKSWEGFGFTNAATIGLSFATLGFIFAIFLGVPLVSWAIRKGYTSVLGKDLPQAFKTGIFPKEQQKESAGTLTTHPATMDTLTFHAALIGLVYVLTYFFVKMLELVTPADIAEMYWGFFFIWGLLIAFLARTVIEKIGAGYMLDARIQGRITGWSVDFLIVASITAVSLAVAWKFVVPILAMAVAAGVITLLWVLYFGKRIWEDYNFERTAGVYGMETGTVATGLILIRIADPSFCTPAATDLALSSIVALPILFVMFHLMNAPILLGWSTGLTVLVFALFMVAILVFLRVFRLWKTPKS